FDTPSQITLMAHGGPGTVFTGWGGPCHADGTVCDLTLGGDTSVEASFALAGPPAPPPPTAPPPPGGPPPPPPGLTAFSEIDNELRRLVPASIAFNAPTTMRLEHTAHIQLLLSPAASIPELK